MQSQLKNAAVVFDRFVGKFGEKTIEISNSFGSENKTLPRIIRQNRETRRNMIMVHT